MIMDTQTRNRPSLEVRTDCGDELANRLPGTSFRRHRSPLPSLSPLTAKSLPSPLQPSTPGYDVGMRQHERAMVESLDGRGRQGSLGRSLSPIAERAIATRVEKMAMDTPLTSKPPMVPFTAPNTPRNNTQHTLPGASSRSIADETMSMLLSGMTASQANTVGMVANRRLSAPADVLLQKNRRQSLALLPPDMLQAWGHVYLNDPAKADVFVAPLALRRHSVESGGQADGIEGNRLAIRARIRPRGKDRKPFLLARSFDLDQLRTTLPTTPSASRRQSIVPLSPEDLSTSARTPTTPLTPLTPGSNTGRRRSSVAASALRVGGHQLKGTAKEMPVRKLGLKFRRLPPSIPHVQG